jgi:hypothetical protein
MDSKGGANTPLRVINLLLCAKAKQSLSREKPTAGAPKTLIPGEFQLASDPNAGGNAFVAHCLFAGDNSIYCWRIAKFVRGNLFTGECCYAPAVDAIIAGE